MNKRCTVSLSNGFSLVELTCALAVVSIGLGSVIHVYLRGIEKMRAIDEYETALCVLNNELETLRAQPWDALEPGDALPFRSAPHIEGLRLAETWAAIEDASGGDAGLKQVTARIRWIGEHGRRIEKELTTFIACTDPLPRTPAAWEHWEEYDDAL